jgi:hypothetical protein
MKPQITRLALPAESLLANPIRPYSYQDSYAAIVPDSLSVQDAAWDFFGQAPAWVSALMRLRNRIVSVFGLKTGGSAPVKKAELKPGTKVGLFRIYSVSRTEVILGEDDRHLDFRVSVLLAASTEGRQLIVSTVVRYRNLLGRIYFFFVRPVHQVIVPAMFRRMLSLYSTAP